uniref:Methionine aminopeptidase n=1 Tax=Arcella intermedia TaxID=1963864 RepID=A0A6B2LB20_9EUKA
MMRPYEVSPRLPVPPHIPAPPYVGFTPSPKSMSDEEVLFDPSKVTIWTEPDIAKMRQSCRLARQILNYAGSLVAPGVTTDEIDRLVHQKIIESGAYPSPLLYYGFPKSICTSINEVVAHGIPDSRPLRSGDVLSIDVTVYLNGFHGDCCDTFVVGKNADSVPVVKVARECMERGIAVCRPNAEFSMIGEAIESHAHAHQCMVVPELTGHGIGTHFHTHPYIAHVRNRSPGRMQAGMIFTIEPIVVEGLEDIDTWEDEWTLSTKDHSRGAQFENTVLITPQGVEVLTRDPDSD